MEVQSLAEMAILVVLAMVLVVRVVHVQQLGVMGSTLHHHLLLIECLLSADHQSAVLSVIVLLTVAHLQETSLLHVHSPQVAAPQLVAMVALTAAVLVVVTLVALVAAAHIVAVTSAVHVAAVHIAAVASAVHAVAVVLAVAVHTEADMVVIDRKYLLGE